MNSKAIICLEKIKLKCAKMNVFESTKILDAAKSPHLYHILTRSTESKRLKPKKKINIEIFGQKTLFLTKNNERFLRFCLNSQIMLSNLSLQ